MPKGRIYKADLYTDGGARGNPGPAGIGIVINGFKDKLGSSLDGRKKFGKYIGERTNNQAEYEALLWGLSKCIELRVREVYVFLDSELLVKQLTGQYRVRNKELKPLFAKVLALTNKFDNVRFKHVVREQNKEADALVNRALNLRGQ